MNNRRYWVLAAIGIVVLAAVAGITLDIPLISDVVDLLLSSE